MRLKRLVGMLAGLAFFPMAGAADNLVVARGVSYSGSPTYLSDLAGRFRDNGGPLSPYGSHFGLKAEVGDLGFAGVLHFACATGRTILDYSRTGLMAVSRVELAVDGRPVAEAQERRIRFEYYGWVEEARFEDLQGEARVCFLGIDQYLIGVRLTNSAARARRAALVLRFRQGGRELTALKSGVGDAVVFRFSVQPTLWKGENYLAAVGDRGLELSKEAGGFCLSSPEFTLSPAASAWSWYIFAYSPESREEAVSLADKARSGFAGPEAAYQTMQKRRDELFARLPPPHLPADDHDSLDLYLMAATALENALYAPRGKMKYWACVPTKVHYNWFWLWDSGFQALGYSEFMPDMARQVILSVFRMQQPDGFIAHMEDEREEPLTPHSQPPVFGFSAPKVLERDPHAPDQLEFKRTMYDKGKLFLGWWKKHRDVNRNGLFEYLSQDEGGWDNSPRADYVPKLVFISYYGFLGELLGGKLKPLDNVDLNSWIYLYYRAMAEWADDLGRPEEARTWREEARNLAGRIDEFLWDPQAQCWLDGFNRLGSKKYERFPVLTPHIWFPAFAGATRDEKKARAVIEKHLLHPAEFFGRYPIPVVAYNDPHYDRKKSGWLSSIWMVTAYSALQTLFRFGYEAEAQELRARLLAMMAGQKDNLKGIYETYDSETGQYKNEFSDGGYASFQFGWSSAFTLEMILERYQEERFIFADTTAIAGFIRRAEDFATREPFYRLVAGRDLPRVQMKSGDLRPLLEAATVKIKLEDPYSAVPRSNFQVFIKGRPFTLELGREYTLELP